MSDSACARCDDGGQQTSAVSGYTTETWIIDTSAGHDIVQMTGTLAECAARCNSEPRCRGFSRATTSSDGVADSCWLKDTMDGAFRITYRPYITYRSLRAAAPSPPPPSSTYSSSSSSRRRSSYPSSSSSSSSRRSSSSLTSGSGLNLNGGRTRKSGNPNCRSCMTSTVTKNINQKV